VIAERLAFLIATVNRPGWPGSRPIGRWRHKLISTPGGSHGVGFFSIDSLNSVDARAK